MINRNSGTVQLKATFPNQNRALWPGAFVNIRLIVDVRKGGISVPLSAIEQGQSSAFVFVVLPDRTVRQRQVVLAETLDGRALIASGLHAGDEVVFAGQYRLSDGVKIVAVPADPDTESC